MSETSPILGDTDTPVRGIRFSEVCPYLPNRQSTLYGFVANKLDPAIYRRLADEGFRRSGQFFYRPECRGCNKCIPLRVLAMEFHPSRSQRRCLKKNADIQVSVGRPALSLEKSILYGRYVSEVHGRKDESEVTAVWDFLYNPVVDSLEFCYRNRKGDLLAVGICDVFADALSSVYCFYEPRERSRGLGTFTALTELDYARRRGLPYYLLGYSVKGCSAMSYKACFRPYELLDVSAAGTGWTSGSES